MPRHLKRNLPLSIFATLAVIVGPVALVSVLVPDHGILWQVLAVVLAVIGSLGFASAGAWLWKRWARSREMIFAELMLWGWVRRFWIERRLERTRDLFESARRYEPEVSLELLRQLSDLHQAIDPYVHGHSRRVASYAVRIAHEMHLSAAEVAQVETAALVHDIGKIYTPAEILLKPERLNEREFAIMKLHARDGAKILAQAGDPAITTIVGQHHERLDGQGYPDGIAGAEISLGARIVAVADTFDAITSIRPYRAPRSHGQAIEILTRESGKQLDADVVAAFIACYAGRRLVRRSAFASAVPERILTTLKASSANLAGGSIAQTLPALGAAGVLAVSPAFHQRGEGRQERGSALVHLASNRQAKRPTAGAAETNSGQPPGRRLLHARESPRVSLPAHGIDSDPSKISSPSTGTSTPGPIGRPPASERQPAPSDPETPKPAPVTPRPPAGGPSPTPTVPLPTPEAPVTVPPVSVPPVTVSVPPPVGVQAPSVSTPTVKLPAIEVPTVTTPSINLQVSG